MIKSILQDIKDFRKESYVIKRVSKFINKNFANQTKERYVPGVRTKIWKSENHSVILFRLIRGDLIEVRDEIEDRKIAAWVDQSNAYGGFLGINDVHIDDDLDRFKIDSILSDIKNSLDTE